jgi:pseudouridine synthase
LKENALTINGTNVTTPETKIDPSIDTITLNGEARTEGLFVYYLLHKPKNVISTTSDELGREDVTSLIQTNREIFPVGRLDKDTTGIILLTDDGELAHQLTHPRYHVPKTYHLTIKGNVTDEQLQTLRTGVELNDGKTLSAEVGLLSSENEQTMLEMTIIEGRNRQIRRMCGVVGINLVELHRVSFGSITLSDMTEKDYRELTADEIEILREMVKKK